MFPDTELAKIIFILCNQKQFSLSLFLVCNLISGTLQYARLSKRDVMPFENGLNKVTMPEKSYIVLECERREGCCAFHGFRACMFVMTTKKTIFERFCLCDAF